MTAAMWTRSFLPGSGAEAPVALGEGGTPLIGLERLAAALGVEQVSGKAELLNPTGSYKDRIASVAVTLARASGRTLLLGTSSGNGGAALAAYGAAAGIPVVLRVAADAADGKLAQAKAYGASVELGEPVLGGSGYERTNRLVAELERRAHDAGAMLFVTAYRFLPEAMVGAETIGVELAEQTEGATAIYVPVGGGGLLTAIDRGWRRTGASPPRIVAVQPRGCATVVEALAARPAQVGEVTTTVSGLQVSVLFDADGVTAALNASGGHATLVSDEEVRSAQRRLAAECGLLVEPAGAAALAGAIADARAGRLGPEDRVVLMLTGHGLKDWAGLASWAGDGAAGGDRR